MPSRGRRTEPEERISQDKILRLAGSATFSRAHAYQQQGRVEGVLRSGSTVAATVRGTVPYRVKLAFGTRPTWSCDCPVGGEGKFCKHCAALAIELLDPEERVALRRRAGDSGSGIAKTLAALSREQLEEIVRLAAVRDARVAQAIETAAAAATGTSVDVQQWAKRIDTAFRTGGFVPYAKAPDWAAAITEVLDGLSDLVSSGYATEVVGLAERAHRKLECSMGHVDDSGGEVVLISGLIADLHLKAAVASAPEPAAFARRLAKLELEGELDTFRRAARAYADVLGEKGLREYRKAVEPKWRKATQGPHDQWSHDRFVATEAMIGVTLASGNPDELVEIVSDRLRTPDDYLEVARAMEAAGRRGEAIRWSRKGLTSLGTRFWQTQSLRRCAPSFRRSTSPMATTRRPKSSGGRTSGYGRLSTATGGCWPRPGHATRPRPGSEQLVSFVLRSRQARMTLESPGRYPSSLKSCSTRAEWTTPGKWPRDMGLTMGSG
ncbi:MAG: hypothetical protein ABSE47_13865 [Acidimicrobiales bacterium]